MKSELEKMLSDIKKNTTQVAINKADEVRVMTCMLNDKDFSLSIYDKKMGYIGQRCPHEDAEKFISDVICRATGLDKGDSNHLAQNYEFTKKDASFLLNNMRDFIDVYTSCGRKINILTNATTDANLFARDIPAGTKIVPDKDNPGQTKEIATAAYTKLVSQSRYPRFLGDGVDDGSEEEK